MFWLWNNSFWLWNNLLTQDVGLNGISMAFLSNLVLKKNFLKALTAVTSQFDLLTLQLQKDNNAQWLQNCFTGVGVYTSIRHKQVSIHWGLHVHYRALGWDVVPLCLHFRS